MAGFREVRETLDRIIGDGSAAHGAFWNGVTLDVFINKPVWGKVPIEVGNPESSNLVLSLRGLPPFGTLFLPRMPKGRPPAREEDIVLIEDWIRNGCPEFSPEANKNIFPENSNLTISDQTHVEYWRAIDNFFLPGLSSEETSIHVGRMHATALEFWYNSYIGGQPESSWFNYLSDSQVTESFNYIREHQNRLISEYYNGVQAYLFDSIWKFGGNFLPVDPLSSARPHHTMNGVLDWFYWVPQLDATSRLGDLSEIDLALMRAWQIGIVADGLLRTDSDRPEEARMPIFDFERDDPNLQAKVYEAYENSNEIELQEAMLNRARNYFPQ